MWSILESQAGRGRHVLGEWDVRSLAGHTSRALATVETYLARPAAAVDVASAPGYFRTAHDTAAGPAVTARARDSGTALGSDPAAAVAQLAARVLALVDTQDGTALVTTIAGGMRLADYLLPPRTFELAVHTAGLATALGVPPDVPQPCTHWRGLRRSGPRSCPATGGRSAVRESGPHIERLFDRLTCSSPASWTPGLRSGE